MSDEQLQAWYRRILEQRAAEDSPRDRCVTPEQIQRLADGTASAEERLRWMDHVAACSMCMGDLAVARATEEAAERLAPRRPQFVRLALAAAIAAFAVGALLWRGGGPTREVMRGPESPITLLRPAGEVSTGADGVQLLWASVPRATRYDVEVLDPSGRPIFAATVSDTMASVPTAAALKSGVDYRWRVSAVLTDGGRLKSTAQAFRIRTP